MGFQCMLSVFIIGDISDASFWLRRLSDGIPVRLPLFSLSIPHNILPVTGLGTPMFDKLRKLLGV